MWVNDTAGQWGSITGRPVEEKRGEGVPIFKRIMEFLLEFQRLRGFSEALYVMYRKRPFFHGPPLPWL